MIDRFENRPTLKSRLLRLLLPYFPDELRHDLLRSALRLPTRLDPQLKIKLAQTQEEFAAAFKLLHDTHLQARIITPDPSGLRVTPYHALPLTKTVIAVLNGEVVGCVSVLVDSQFGLPMANTFDLSELRNRNRRIVEIFGLSLRADVRRNHSLLLMPLFKYVYHFIESCIQADYAVIAVDPNARDLYETILCFTPMTGPFGKTFGSVNGLAAMSAYINVKTYRLALAAHYKQAAPEQNLHSFLTYSFANLELPDPAHFRMIQPMMSPETLDYFFNKRTNLFDRLSPEKLNIIAGLYDLDLYSGVFPQAEVNHRSSVIAREPRFHVELQGRCIAEGGRMLPAVIHDISLSGFKAEITELLNFGEPVHMTIAIGDSDMIDVRATPVRKGQGHVYGFQIAQAQQGWKYFIELLAQERLQQRFEAPSPALRITKVS